MGSKNGTSFTLHVQCIGDGSGNVVAFIRQGRRKLFLGPEGLVCGIVNAAHFPSANIAQQCAMGKRFNLKISSVKPVS